jgi:hypothetical protein
MSREARHKALVQHVEEAHRALQASLAHLKVRIEASDAGLYPADALGADLEHHAELTRKWTEAMSELAKFHRDAA